MPRRTNFNSLQLDDGEMYDGNGNRILDGGMASNRFVGEAGLNWLTQELDFGSGDTQQTITDFFVRNILLGSYFSENTGDTAYYTLTRSGDNLVVDLDAAAGGTDSTKVAIAYIT